MQRFESARRLQRKFQNPSTKSSEILKKKLQEGLASGMDWTDGNFGDLRRSLEAIRKSVVQEIEKIQSA